MRKWKLGGLETKEGEDAGLRLLAVSWGGRGRDHVPFLTQLTVSKVGRGRV